MIIDAKKIAGLVVKDIVADINDRSGLDGMWSGIDDETKREIKKEWCALIEKRIAEELNPAPIERFSGKYRFLSNFFVAPFEVAVMTSPTETTKMTFPSVEHAYQAMKIAPGPGRIEQMRVFTDPGMSAGDAKRRGRALQLRSDWEDIKLRVMEWLLVDKFTQHQHLRDQLVATGSAELVEGNNWGDTFWGRDDRSGLGANHLGYALMRVRDRVRDPEYKGPR